MLETALESDWILTVADVAAQFRSDLARIDASESAAHTGRKGIMGDIRRQLDDEAIRAERVNAVRVADIRLQRADPEYATRAGSNNAHFLLARPTAEFTAREYVESTLRGGSEINAVGVWGWYHLSALQKATRLARETLGTEERSMLVRSMLADEAFALHFIEDTFAAGHVAGTWGDVSQRKGTHDYYNERGIAVDTWESDDRTLVLTGDAHMRPEDAQRASQAARLSLEQLLDTAAGRMEEGGIAYAPSASMQPEAFDVCRNDRLGQHPAALAASSEAIAMGVAVLKPTPVPGLGEGLGSMPRFRAEVGPFIGVSGQLDLRHVSEGFTGLEERDGYIVGADLSVRVGYGLEGVLGESGDGRLFLAAGYRGDAQSTNKFTDQPFAEGGGGLTSAIPGRTALTARLRMPFYLVPGDLLLMAPMYFIAPTAYQNMAVQAANGGLIPWQLAWATRFGRFQFVLGREIGVTFYGRQSEDTLFVAGDPPGTPRIIAYKSNHYDFPILEYRPYRAFDSTQTSELVIQLFGGVDDPQDVKVLFPEDGVKPRFDNVYSIGIRVVFDWRRYF
jgi:hypothetical protein